MAVENAGGFVELSLNGVPYRIAGELVTEELGYEREAVVNSDGTVQAITKPAARKFTIKFRDREGQFLVQQIFAADRIDASAREVHMRRTTLLTGGRAVGKPTRNMGTGEIDGVEIVSDQVQYIND